MDFFDPAQFDVLLMVMILMIPTLLLSKVIPLYGAIAGLIIMGIILVMTDSSFMVPMLFIVSGSALVMWKGA